ncbi:hypothetical protein C8F04DRAFT_1187736 [Mycena alexandri]|uniref:Uncharacterized protein n=1 Tax=Mycena alexandri TaxID=1745969 RepID=A0AAD6SN46_9AGAR|nr:hypothetical protein C8F04DRAFT_1187736 [Mycena alexandri]
MDTTARGTTPKSTSTSTAITPLLDAATAESIVKRFERYTTRPELLEHMEEKVGKKLRDTETARAYLENGRWIDKGAPLNREVMFSILLKVSLLPQTTLKLMAGTIRALAFMAETIDSVVADEVADVVGPIVNSVVDSQENLHGEVLGLVRQVSDLQAAVEEKNRETAGEVQALRVQLAVMQTRMDEASAGAKEDAQKMAAWVATQLGELRNVVTEAGAAAVTVADGAKAVAAAVSEVQAAAKTAPAGTRSFAATAATGMPVQAGVLARAARMRRQILIDKGSETTASSMSTLSEVELKVKANLALTLMTEKLEGAAFVGARKLDNGGVVFDCLNEKTATWPRALQQGVDTERDRDSRGQGRLAGGAPGQGGGGGAPVDGGWGAMRQRAQEQRAGNSWSDDGLYQSHIPDVFAAQPRSNEWGRGGFTQGGAIRGGRGAMAGPSRLRNELARGSAGTQGSVAQQSRDPAAAVDGRE